MDFYKGNIPILETDKNEFGEMADIFHPLGQAKGYVERDYKIFPEPMFQAPSEMELYPESEYDARYDEQETLKSSLEHIYLSGPNGGPAFTNLDQDGDGYCWGYSTGHSIMIDRLAQNLPLVRLNPHGPCSIIKHGANQGGWCGESAKFGRENGYPVEGTAVGQWPKWSRDYKRYDTPECRAQMALHMIAEDWVDLTRQLYDQNLTQSQCATCGFNNIPGPRDYNFWSHSVCGLRWVRVERGSWGQLILNSWLNWGRFGLAVLIGSKRICNGGLGVRRTLASAA